MNDQILMQRAIYTGETARLISPPNPWVGCVIFKNGLIIGEGASEKAGERHAEIVALAQTQGSIEGATVYVTLEPCSHTGKTPPCIDALIKNKVKRVVVALIDPDIRVNGKGISALQQAGIEVTVGIEADLATQSLAPYLHHRRTNLPYIVIKTALSIDGRSAAEDGSSQWISSVEAREDAHRLRAESQAILIGSETALKDNPRLTVRKNIPDQFQQPLRIILDTRGRLKTTLQLFCTKDAKTLIVTSKTCPLETIQYWQEHDVEVVILPQNHTGKGINLHCLCELLGKRGILQLLVEGGSQLQGSLLAANLWDRLVVYTGDCLLGDKALPAFSGFTISSMENALRTQLAAVNRKGNSVRLDYLPKI